MCSGDHDRLHRRLGRSRPMLTCATCSSPRKLKRAGCRMQSCREPKLRPGHRAAWRRGHGPRRRGARVHRRHRSDRSGAVARGPKRFWRGCSPGSTSCPSTWSSVGGRHAARPSEARGRPRRSPRSRGRHGMRRGHRSGAKPVRLSGWKPRAVTPAVRARPRRARGQRGRLGPGACVTKWTRLD